MPEGEAPYGASPSPLPDEFLVSWPCIIHPYVCNVHILMEQSFNLQH